MGNRLSRRIVLGSILKFCTEQHYTFFCNGLLQFISFMLKFTKLCNLNQNRSVVRFSHSSIRRHVNFESKDFTCFLSNLPFNLWIWSCFLHKHRVVILWEFLMKKYKHCEHCLIGTKSITVTTFIFFSKVKINLRFDRYLEQKQFT